MTLVLAASPACKAITLNPDRVIAIEIADAAPRVEAGDTARLIARPLNAAGQPVSGTTVSWAVLDTGAIPFQLGASGLVTALQPGTARVQASADDLRSDPIVVTVTALPDTAARSGPARIIVPATDVQSAALAVTVSQRGTGGALTGIGGKTVVYQAVLPAGSTGYFLAATDTVPGVDPRRTVALTASTGVASARVRRRVGVAAPDSVVVDATAVTARGATVPGTPTRFVVVFQ